MKIVGKLLGLGFETLLRLIKCLFHNIINVSQRFADLCEGRVPKLNITLMKDVSLMKAGAKGQYLYNKAQDILYDEVFEKYFFNNKVFLLSSFARE